LSSDAEGKLSEISSSHTVEGKTTTIVAPGDNKTKDAVIDLIRSNSGDVVSVTATRRTLEDIFIETVREGESEAGEALHLSK
jgi:hypothetical protein